MDTPVEKWLYKYWQKKDVGTQDIQVISEAVLIGVDALRTALANIGINIKQGKLKEFERVRMPELIGIIQSQSRTQVESAMSPKTRTEFRSEPPRILQKENSEQSRVQEAVDEAVALGIIREEVIPSDTSDARDIYILSSSHYGNLDYDPKVTPQAVKNAQVQLFQLAHLLDIRGASSPIFVEGRQFGMGYNRPMRDHWKRDGIDLDNAEVQKELFQEPQRLIRLFDEHQKISGKTGVSTPVFYEYTGNIKIAGAHSPATDAKLIEFSTNWLPWETKLKAKYAALEAGWKGKKGEAIQVSIGTGWQEDKPLLEIGDKWFFAHDVRTDCENYFRFAQLLQELNTARENDVSALMQQTKPEFSPMAFMGLAHTMSVTKIVKPWAKTHILTPVSAIDKDHLRSDIGVPIHALENYRQLHYIACNVPSLRKP